VEGGLRVVLEREQRYDVVPKTLHNQSVEQGGAARGVLVVKRHGSQALIAQEWHPVHGGHQFLPKKKTASGSSSDHRWENQACAKCGRSLSTKA
jgi:hypothetical protein